MALRPPADARTTTSACRTVAATPDLARAVRRGRLPPGGPQPAAAIVAGMPLLGQRAALEDDGPHPQHRQDRLHRRHAPGPGTRPACRTCSDFVAAGGLLIGGHGHGGAGRELRAHPGRGLGAGGEARRRRARSCARRWWTPPAPSRTAIRSPSRSTPRTGRSSASRAWPAAASRPTAGGGQERPDRPRHRRRSRSPPGPRRSRRRPTSPSAEAWEALPLTEEQRRNPIYVIPPAQRPRAVVALRPTRKSCLVSGLLDGGGRHRRSTRRWWTSRRGRGHVVLFSNNPIWRGRDPGQLRSSSSTRILELRPALSGPHAGGGIAQDLFPL